VNPSRNAIRQMLARRLDVAGLYLCGPFDTAGEPCSPDIHVLAITRRDDAGDLHYLPGVADVCRRVEVSAVAQRELESAVGAGVSTWPMFYLLDKLRHCAVIDETADLQALRERAVAELKVRPSFYSDLMRSLASQAPAAAAGARLQAPAGPMALLEASGTAIRALALSAIIAGRRTFSKTSEIVSEASGRALPVAPPDLGPNRPFGAKGTPAASRGDDLRPAVASITVGRMIEASRRFVADVLRPEGIDFGRLTTGRS
jgi:hypothetical protein